MTGQYILSDYLNRATLASRIRQVGRRHVFRAHSVVQRRGCFCRHLARMRRRTAFRVGRLSFARLETRTQIADFERHRFEREIYCFKNR